MFLKCNCFENFFSQKNELNHKALNIKELRIEFNLTQQELSDATGIPKGRINAWEQRNSKPKVDDYNTLSTFFSKLREQKFSNENIPFDKFQVPFDKFSQMQEMKVNYLNKEQKQEQFIRVTELTTRENHLHEKIALLEQRLKDREELIAELRHNIAMQKEVIDTLKENFSPKNSSTPTTTIKKQQQL